MKLLPLHHVGRSTAGVFADSVNDVSSTRNLYLLALGLIVLGGVLLAITVWFWHSTRPEPELLAPLEQMGARKFRQLDGRSQKELLDSVRPDGAQPMRWGVVHGEPIAGTEIDLEAAARAEMIGYDDLRDPNESSDPLLDPQPAPVALASADTTPPPGVERPLEAEFDDDPVAESRDVPVDPLLRISDRNDN